MHWNEEHRRPQVEPPQHGYGYQVLTGIVPQRLNGAASLDIIPGQVRWTLCAELKP